jgi:tripartite-type tricarboxylate transporter receptor subunit TctC
MRRAGAAEHHVWRGFAWARTDLSALCPPCGWRLIAALSVAAALAVAPAAAAEYPDRPIHLIVPLQPGSLSDNLARILGARLGERLHQQIVVENRVGGSTVVASEAVARAAPDGYTLEIANTSSHATVAATGVKLPFDPVADFAPVGMIGTSPFVLVASNPVRVQTVAELIALARREPGRLSYASAGTGTIAHLATVLLERLAHIELTHVPYRGTSQAVFDIMEGRIDLEVGTLSGTEPHIRAGKLRALAVMSPHRIPQLPDTPTIAEAGVPGAEVELWSALVVPAAVRPTIVARLNRELQAVLALPDVDAAVRAQGVDPQPGSPEAAAALIKADFARWNDVIRSAGLMPKN